LLAIRNHLLPFRQNSFDHREPLLVRKLTFCELPDRDSYEIGRRVISHHLAPGKRARIAIASLPAGWQLRSRHIRNVHPEESEMFHTPVRFTVLAGLVWVLQAMSPTLQAGPILSTPAGLTPGETFRFVFVTSGTTDATSANISDYDNFVNTQANGATYNGTTVSWLAIGSTASISAITHDGTNPGIQGVYLVNGTQIATSDDTAAGGLWSGSLLSAPDVDINGMTTVFPNTFTWTGTLSNGQAAGPSTTLSPGGALGESAPPPLNSVVEGHNTDSGSTWVTNGISTETVQLNLYGISAVLTVPEVTPPTGVPEPSTGLLAVIGVSIGLVVSRFRKAKDQGQPGLEEATIVNH
jgi:hypothetical protein